MHLVAKGKDSLHDAAEPPNEGPTKEKPISLPEEEIVAMRANHAGLAPMMFAMTVLVLAAIAGFWAIGTSPSFSAIERTQEQHSIGNGVRAGAAGEPLRTGQPQSVVRR